MVISPFRASARARKPFPPLPRRSRFATPSRQGRLAPKSRQGHRGDAGRREKRASQALMRYLSNGASSRLSANDLVLRHTPARHRPGRQWRNRGANEAIEVLPSLQRAIATMTARDPRCPERKSATRRPCRPCMEFAVIDVVTQLAAIKTH